MIPTHSAIKSRRPPRRRSTKRGTSFDIPTVSLHVHERIDPRAIIEAVRKKNWTNYEQLSLFGSRLENPPIRIQADRLLAPELADVDGNREERKGTVSLFNGPPPSIVAFKTQDGEIAGVAEWLMARTKEGIVPHEIGVFVRSQAELARAHAATERAGLQFKVLDDNVETVSGRASISTMHLAKGLEFRAVVVMACDDEVIPLQERIETVVDDADLEEVYNTERHLLYVACTRARDHLLVTSVDPASEFLDRLCATLGLGFRLRLRGFAQVLDALPDPNRGGLGGLGVLEALHWLHGGRVYGTSRIASTGTELRLQMDVTDDAPVQRAIDTIIEREGRLDISVNNA